MDKRIVGKYCILIIFSVISLFLWVSCGNSNEKSDTQNASEDKVLLTEFHGQSLLKDRCSRCHNLSRVKDSKKSKQEWTITVNRMVSKGAVLKDNEIEAIVEFLVKTYGS
jgi:hypothetical protein